MLRIEDLNIGLGSFKLKNICMDVTKGEYHVLLGPSGAGKSVLLNLIAGFYKPDSGRIIYQGNDISNTAANKRHISLLFQDLALFPNMNVFENVAFPLNVRKFKHEQIKTEVLRYLELTEIDKLQNRSIKDLSGGEKQRVAIARCLVSGADLILLDEPLTAVDVQLRGALKHLLKDIQALGKTIIHVTHDLNETKDLADRLSVINNGEIVASGTYNGIFDDPDIWFTASFNERKNYYEFLPLVSNGVLNITDGISLNIDTGFPVENYKGVYIHPSKVRINKKDETATFKMTGIIKSLKSCDYGIEIEIESGINISCLLSIEEYEQFNIKPNDTVRFSFNENDLKFIRK